MFFLFNDKVSYLYSNMQYTINFSIHHKVNSAFRLNIYLSYFDSKSIFISVFTYSLTVVLIYSFNSYIRNNHYVNISTFECFSCFHLYYVQNSYEKNRSTYLPMIKEKQDIKKAKILLKLN